MEGGREGGREGGCYSISSAETVASIGEGVPRPEHCSLVG